MLNNESSQGPLKRYENLDSLRQLCQQLTTGKTLENGWAPLGQLSCLPAPDATRQPPHRIY